MRCSLKGFKNNIKISIAIFDIDVINNFNKNSKVKWCIKAFSHRLNSYLSNETINKNYSR